MKKKHVALVLILVLFVALLILAVCHVTQKSRICDLLDDSTAEIFAGTRNLAERLEFISHSGEYSVKDSEKIQYYLATLEANVRTLSKLSDKKELAASGFATLANALGHYYSAQHNDVMAGSVLYDGKVSADELEFISALCADLNILLGTMLSEDGLGMKDGLSYEDIKEPLGAFLSKWGEWSWNSEAPYDLLNA